MELHTMTYLIGTAFGLMMGLVNGYLFGLKKGELTKTKSEGVKYSGKSI